MSARHELRASHRSKANRRTVDQAAANNRGVTYSAQEWAGLGRNRRRDLTADAKAALARVDGGVELPGDREAADRYDLRLQQDAFTPPDPLCRHGQTADCNSCFLDHDDHMRRAEDI